MRVCYSLDSDSLDKIIIELDEACKRSIILKKFDDIEQQSAYINILDNMVNIHKILEGVVTKGILK